MSAGTIDECDRLRAELSEAGVEMADLLSSSLMPKSGSWDGCRAPYVWEHNALCWLSRNRAVIGPINGWTAKVVDEGYPFRPFRDHQGIERPAGWLWNNGMTPDR